MGIGPQSLCNSLDVVDRDVALAPLDSAEICSIHLNIEGKILLTQAARFPVAADIRSYDLASASGMGALNPYEPPRSEEHTSELQSLMRNSYAVFCLTKKTKHNKTH